MSERRSRESQPFKDFFSPALVEDLAQRIQAVYPTFSSSTFVAQVTPLLSQLELKRRNMVIAAGLRDYLPAYFPEAIRILLAILGPPLAEDEGMFTHGWYLMPLATFVEQYGLDYFHESVAAMHAITQRHTAEFAIRPFLMRYPGQTLAVLQNWTNDPSFHVRRLVSEGTRTRLPWASYLPQFITNPLPVLELLELLKDDPSAFVRRSVANNLNDITKDHPDLVLSTLKQWKVNASRERQSIIRHALRTLIKQGHPEALRILGADTPEVHMVSLELIPNEVKIGDSTVIAITLRSIAKTAQQIVVDYVVHMPSLRGKTRMKVFKFRSQRLEAGETLRLEKQHSFASVSIRLIYPGIHHIAIQVNGVILGMGIINVLEGI